MGTRPANSAPSAPLRLLRMLLPPPAWRLPVLLLGGVGLGLGAVTLHVSNATSYLSDDPRACVNCHVMEPQFATWERGSHARVATCNDCHVPHDNVFKKYAFKASDGTRHAFMFTFHLEPQVIQVHEPGQKVIQDNCIRCHEHLLTTATPAVAEHETLAVSFDTAAHGGGKLCWECHRETPHGRVNSLSATQWARVPGPDPVLPDWLAEQLSPSSSPSHETDH